MILASTQETCHLDPESVRPSRWANRGEDSFKGKVWTQFKDEIASAGGNVQPIKVRPVLQKNNNEFEIVFGHRRHRACLELGIRVLAFVDELTDPQLFEEMDRENRLRANLSPWEQGHMYRLALDEGLYPSLRKMAEALGSSVGNMSAYINLARLPDSVLNSFESRLDIQQRWISPLVAEVGKNPDIAIACAKQILAERKQGSSISSLEVFRRIARVTVLDTKTRQVKLPGGSSLQITTGKTVKFEFTKLDAKSLEQVERAIVEVLSNRAHSNKSVAPVDLFGLAGVGK